LTLEQEVDLLAGAGDGELGAARWLVYRLLCLAFEEVDVLDRDDFRVAEHDQAERDDG